MIIYEVNLWIEESIFDEYKQWLHGHINDMLQFDGFIEAKLLFDLTSKNSADINHYERKLVVQYFVKSLNDLQKYFDQFAQTMRQQAIDKFGNKFKAERRILEMQHSYVRHPERSEGSVS